MSGYENTIAEGGGEYKRKKDNTNSAVFAVIPRPILQSVSWQKSG